MIRRVQKSEKWLMRYRIKIQLILSLQFSLEKVDAMGSLIKSLNGVQRELIDLLKNSGEFSINELPFLSEPDEEASLLLGTMMNSDLDYREVDPIKIVRESNKKQKNYIYERLGKAEILLNEAEEIKRLLFKQ